MYLTPFKNLCFRTGQALCREENKAMESFEGSFCNLNFSPSTSILLNFFFLFIDIRCFFVKYFSTLVQSFCKEAKAFKETSFSKATMVMAISRQEKTPVAQKHRAISRQEKMAFSTPSSGCLGTSLPLPQSLCGRT